MEAEVAALLAGYDDHRTETGRRRLVRHGHGPEREILTGIGAGSSAAAESTGPGRRGGGSDPVFLDDPAAFRAPDALVGRGAADAVSAGSVERGLRGGAVGAGGSGGVRAVAGCDRSSQIGMGSGARALAAPESLEPTVWLCLGGRDLPSGSAGRREAVRFGVDRGDAGGPEGTAGVPGGVPGERSELAGTPGGSKGAWPHDPPGTGDRGRGSRLLEALDASFPKTRRQRCWVHKTANVLNALPKARQRNAKQDLHQIWMAAGRAAAEKALDTFAAKYQAKYPKAVTCLTKDREELLAFYDFPAEHWQHIRTTNPIESVFATVRHRTVRSKGCLSHETALAMVFKLVTAASKTWLVPPQRLREVAPGHPGRQIHRRHSGRRNRNTRCRLIMPSPTFDHSSCGNSTKSRVFIQFRPTEFHHRLLSRIYPIRRRGDKQDGSRYLSLTSVRSAYRVSHDQPAAASSNNRAPPPIVCDSLNYRHKIHPKPRLTNGRRYSFDVQCEESRTENTYDRYSRLFHAHGR